MKRFFKKLYRASRAVWFWKPPTATLGVHSAYSRWEAWLKEWSECRYCIWWNYCKIHKRSKCEMP